MIVVRFTEKLNGKNKGLELPYRAKTAEVRSVNRRNCTEGLTAVQPMWF